jgi:hypothetical protein
MAQAAPAADLSEVIARLSEIIASRLLANRNAIDPLPGDQEKIDISEWQRF